MLSGIEPRVLPSSSVLPDHHSPCVGVSFLSRGGPAVVRARRLKKRTNGYSSVCVDATPLTVDATPNFSMSNFSHAGDSSEASKSSYDRTDLCALMNNSQDEIVLSYSACGHNILLDCHSSADSCPSLPPGPPDPMTLIMAYIALGAVGLLLICVLGCMVYNRLKRREHSAHTLRLRSTNAEPELQLATNHYFHLFLSHVWSTGQDQVAVIRRRLEDLLPSAHIFLDVSGVQPDRLLMPAFGCRSLG